MVLSSCRIIGEDEEEGDGCVVCRVSSKVAVGMMSENPDGACPSSATRSHRSTVYYSTDSMQSVTRLETSIT